MSAYYPGNTAQSSKRTIVFIIILAFHALIIYAFATGLVSSGKALLQTILQTNIIQTEKVQELPPPPPHVDLKVPPPVSVVAPEVNITLPPTPAPIHIAPKPPPPAPVIHVPPAPIIPAKLINPPDPADYYPDSSRRNGEQGRAMVKLCVNERGRVGTADIIATSGHPALDGAAIQYAKALRFKPATRAGKPIDACMSLPVRFELTNG
jgi:periplasmic protein TonB